jgi:V/A-type H+-transporting ATPase subunit I
MQKVRLSVYVSDVDAALDTIQRSGAVEFTATDLTDVDEPEIQFTYAELLPKIQHAVQFLKPYAPKKGLWKTLREGSTDELTEEELKKKLENTDVILPLVKDFERLQVEFAEVNEKLRLLEEQHSLLSDWKELPIKLNQLETNSTKTYLVSRNLGNETMRLSEVLKVKLLEQEIPFTITEVSENAVALTIAKEQGLIQKTDALIASVNAESITPPKGEETPEIVFTAVSEKLAKTKGDLALLHDQAEHFAHTHINQLRVAGEILSWQKDRFDVVGDAAATKYTVVFDGWLNKNKREDVEAEFKSKDIGAMFSELELVEGEEPPVDIENNALVQPFEAVTRLYGMPGHNDLDPTAYLAGFFFLFFGLSLTDVGYGLFLMVSSAIIITLFKVSDAIKLFAKLLFLVGLATVFVGALFGGYFGIALTSLPEPLQAFAKFDPIGNPLPVFYLALGLGVFQIMVGMLVRIYSEYKQNRLMTGIMDQGPWLFIFCMAIFALLTSIGYVSVVSIEVIKNLIYFGVALVVLSSGRKGETVLLKIQSAAAGLYSSIGYFSDILSYSRLLALGLATTALAFAVNLIAGMVVDVPYVGYILAGIILLIGHAFNLAVNTLGAFIHSARLQFVEFFGKFISGTGRQFAPLKRTEKHVTVKEQ